MASVQEFIDIYRDSGAPESLGGYGDDEVIGLESQYNVQLPPSFVAYLKLMGHGTDWLFLGTDTSLNYLKQLRQWADRLLVENGDPFRLHPRDFVFRQGSSVEGVGVNSGAGMSGSGRDQEVDHGPIGLDQMWARALEPTSSTSFTVQRGI